ncbi:uncharacterized protein RJT21DRAFT_25849 [Scheffersomyces amazonensis]|uniref:uncharacterized protein n=1 Tax=Scheffersomyces amazonensis TaxID=1078765 RepID=UPI00315D4203
MSFNSPLGFSISKSTPTTSTTNTNGTSTTPSSHESTTTPKSPFFQNILAKTSPSIETSPKVLPTTFVDSTTTPVLIRGGGDDGNLSTTTTINNISHSHNNNTNNNTVNTNNINNKVSSNSINSSINNIPNKSDLIGLFDKFDIGVKPADSSEPDKQVHEDGEENKEEKKEDEIDQEQEQEQEQDSTTNEKVTVEVNKTSLMTIQPYNPELTSTEIVQEASSSSVEESVHEQDLNEKEQQDDNKDLTDITGDVEGLESSEIEEYELKNDETSKRRPTISSIHSESKISRIAQPQVNPEEQYQQSHKPFYFQNFLNQLKKKSADPIVRYIRSFLVSFLRQGHTFTAEQRIKIIQDFKNFMNEKFTLYEPFSSMDEIDLENSREGLEKLIMNRLYIHCFPPEVIKENPNYIPPSFEDNLKDDKEFSKQVEKFSWINGIHLDININQLSESIKDNERDFLQYSITEMNKINGYRAPRDKIICILNACKIIFSYLKVSKQETNADEFIPLLILVLIKAKTNNLISNINYIENFRGQEWLIHGETSYYLSSIQGAIGFIQNLNVKDLTVEQDEYNAHLEAWEAEEKQKQAQQALISPQPVHIPQSSNNNNTTLPPSQGLSPSSVLITSAEMFTKSISNFLSPSPQQDEDHQHQHQHQHQPEESETHDIELEKSTFNNLQEIFPTLDIPILKDIVYMNKGDIDICIDTCLKLVNDI